MRRRHWWGAAVGAGVLACVGFVAPAALAAVPKSSPGYVVEKPTPNAKYEVKKGYVAPKHRPDVKPGKPANHHHHAHYPPHATPSVHLSLPSHARIGKSATVTAKVSINNTPVAGASAGLYGSIDGGNTWKKYSETTTGSDGTVTFSYTPRHAVTLRVVVAGGSGYAASQSDAQALHLKR